MFVSAFNQTTDTLALVRRAIAVGTRRHPRRAASPHAMLNEGPLEEMHPRLCADPCRLTGIKRRHELNEHLVDRIKPLALGRVSVPLSRSAQP